MKTAHECIPCFIRQTQNVAKRLQLSVQEEEALVKQAEELIKKQDLALSPPEIAGIVFDLIKKTTGIYDPLKEIKRQSLYTANKLLQEIKHRTDSAMDVFEQAVRLAIAGNIIDFGAKLDVNQKMIEDSIASALTQPLNRDVLKQFNIAAQKAASVLYLCDNAGEIVFDQILMRVIGPQKITAVVRGAPVINDATLEDARDSGLTPFVRVIDNGTNIPGTVIEKCSAEFKKALLHADLVISKGQGNFETLIDVQINKTIFFLLKVKCETAAHHTKHQIGELVILNRKSKEAVAKY